MAKDQFSTIVNDTLPSMLDKLKRCDLHDRLYEFPKNGGIYVFYEKKKPIYVGRTDNLKRRIREHGQPGAHPNTASFAFRLAREIVKEDNKISAIEFNNKYASIFTSQKLRVAKMTIKYVEVKDCIVQSILEVYVHIHLKTKKEHNDFCNH